MPESLQDLKLALESRPAEVKDLARRLLAAGVPHGQVADALKAGLRSLSARSRAAAVASLGALRTPRAWDALAAALADPDPALRAEALRSIAEADDDASLARLAAAAGHADPELRRGALVALSARSGPERDAVLRTLLAAKDPWIRRSALEALATAGFDKARDAVAAALKDEHPTVRAAAARIAATAPDAPALELLLPAADDADREVQRHARQRLESLRLGAPAIVDVLGRLPRARGEHARALLAAWFAPAPTTELAGLLGRHGPLADAVLVETVSGRGDDGRAALEPVLRGPHGASVLEALFAIGTADYFAGLIARWPGLHLEVRRRLVDRAAAEPWGDAALEQGAADPDAAVREPATRALLAKGRADLVPGDGLVALFAASLDGGSWTDSQREQLARRAAKAGPAALPALARGAASKGAGLRRACAEALVELDARDALASLAGSDDPVVLKHVALHLGERGDERALEPLVRLAEEGHGDLPKRARKLLESFAAQLTVERFLGWMSHRRPPVRCYAAERLGTSGDARAIPALIRAVSDDAVTVQLAAVFGLRGFTSSEEVVDRLLECIQAADFNVRRVAIEALGEAKVERAVKPLTALLGNRLLKAPAAEALKRIGDRQGMLAILRRKRREEKIDEARGQIATRNARRGRNVAAPVKKKTKR